MSYYNNIGQSSYNSYGYPQTPVQPQMPQPNGNFYNVKGYDGASVFMCPPNSNIVLFDTDSNKFFIKSANTQGQSTLKAFEYKEIVNEIPPVSNNNTSMDKYVEKKDFDKLSKEFESLKTQLKKDNKETKK